MRIFSSPRRCIVSMPGADDSNLRRQQISYNGKADDGEIYAPYGMSYNIPADSLSLYFVVSNDPGNLIVMPDRPNDRIKNLAEGEVAIFNPLTKTNIIFKQNGDLDIVTTGDSGQINANVKSKINIDTGDDVTINCTGDVNINTTGDFNLTAIGDVNITGSQINLN